MGRLVLLCAFLGACGGGDDDDAVCDFDLAFELGDEGSADPLAIPAGQARAGRLAAADLPASALGLWRAGDFVLANERVALLIEDVGPSDLYDPWGGRPIGVARVQDGALVGPADFGEFFILTGRNSLVTTSVGVISDGSDGGPAIVRAVGVLRPTPFFEAIVGGIFRDTFEDVPTAIDYVLEPGADHVDVQVIYHSPRIGAAEVPTTLHGYMFNYRNGRYAPGYGFDTEGKDVPYIGFIDDDGTSYAYSVPGVEMDAAVSVSGFSSNYSPGFTIAACAETARTHLRLTIGGPGVDALIEAVARTDGTALREITGVVRDAGGLPAAGVRVHAETGDSRDYLTRATTGTDGGYALHVPDGAAVRLTAYRRGDAMVGPIDVGATQATQDLALPATGTIHVTAEDADFGDLLPVRVQVLPAGASAIPAPPVRYGEEMPMDGRLHVDYAVTGESTLRVPPGEWQVVVSRGYEYEIHEEVVTVAAGETASVAAVLPRVIDTTGLMCADYHIHTIRSADSGDDAVQKVMSGAADGLDIPVRSEHEWADDFGGIVADLGLQQWMFGMASVELTTMELYGHFGVIPLEIDPARPNQGTPLWQEFADELTPDRPLRNLTPPELFDAVRARPEQPTIIINHPRGGANYFDYVGYDRDSRSVLYPEYWDEEFTVVEVFNDSGWKANQERTVADWLSFLDDGRRVFAVGSSDSHGIRSSPIGYPRTCLELGTDDPAAIDARDVADATAGGHATISGGIYVSALVGGAGPGDEATGTGTAAQVDITVQAASWVDVDFIEVVVDGQVVDTIAILPEDADQTNPAIRWAAPVTVDVAPAGSYVIVAVYGDGDLSPVHPGRIAFGVTNPIFLTP